MRLLTFGNVVIGSNNDSESFSRGSNPLSRTVFPLWRRWCFPLVLETSFPWFDSKSGNHVRDSPVRRIDTMYNESWFETENMRLPMVYRTHTHEGERTRFNLLVGKLSKEVVVNVSYIKCEHLPPKYKGRWDHQSHVRITFKHTYNDGKSWFPYHPSRESVKTYVKNFVHDFSAEKDEDRQWYDYYLDTLEQVDEGVWEACVLQAWLD